MFNTKKIKEFLIYYHDCEKYYYNELLKKFHDEYEYESVTDNSLERLVDSDDIDYVMRCIRENYIAGISCAIVLVGNESWWWKYIDWGTKEALDKQHGLLGVQLPTLLSNYSGQVNVPGRLNNNIEPVFSLSVILADFTANISSCRRYIEKANRRSKTMIKNIYERCLRNASYA
ncbi:TIR domain-containing protein [Pectobacterium parmentieri]|uniref:TIR domain-containing protein n=1 Tax=Pectobacterium parmentieri TaxID=1905730 RepID=UPI002031A259|nr:TIR domain-containing protein [Pectobacterium parmentieri]MCL6381565.1 hypothetical protein [Pectobacterium parmentieri]